MILERVFLEAGALRAMMDEAKQRKMARSKFVRELASRCWVVMEDLNISEGWLSHAVQSSTGIVADHPLSNYNIWAHGAVIARIICRRADEMLRSTPIGKKGRVTYRDKRPPVAGIVLMQEGLAIRIATSLNTRRGTYKSRLLLATDPGIREIKIG